MKKMIVNFALSSNIFLGGCVSKEAIMAEGYFLSKKIEVNTGNYENQISTSSLVCGDDPRISRVKGVADNPSRPIVSVNNNNGITQCRIINY